MSQLLTNLDGNQVLQNSHDEANQLLRVGVFSGSAINLGKVEDPSFIDATTINNNSGSFLELIASTSAAIKMIHLFDTSGKFLELATGGSGSEQVFCVLGPGNDQPIYVQIPVSSRISIRCAESSAPSAGNVSINYLG